MTRSIKSQDGIIFLVSASLLCHLPRSLLRRTNARPPVSIPASLLPSLSATAPSSPSLGAAAADLPSEEKRNRIRIILNEREPQDRARPPGPPACPHQPASPPPPCLPAIPATCKPAKLRMKNKSGGRSTRRARDRNTSIERERVIVRHTDMMTKRWKASTREMSQFEPKLTCEDDQGWLSAAAPPRSPART